MEKQTVNKIRTWATRYTVREMEHHQATNVSIILQLENMSHKKFCDWLLHLVIELFHQHFFWSYSSLKSKT